MFYLVEKKNGYFMMGLQQLMVILEFTTIPKLSMATTSSTEMEFAMYDSGAPRLLHNGV